MCRKREGRVVACGGSRLEYYLDRVQEAGVGLLNAAMGGVLSLEAAEAESSKSSAYPSPAPTRIRARSNEMSGIISHWARISHVSRCSWARPSDRGCANPGGIPRNR
jgi:hypothetical protein